MEKLNTSAGVKLDKRVKDLKRWEHVGSEGIRQQDQRAAAAGEAGAAREAIKRVGEYKRGRVDPSDGNNDLINRRSVEKL